MTDIKSMTVDELKELVTDDRRIKETDDHSGR